MGTEYENYHLSINSLKLKPLSQRRKQICQKFAIKTQKNPKFTDWFVENEPESYMKTRAKTNRFKMVQCRTAGYEKSPLPYLTKLLNDLNGDELLMLS